MLPAHVGSGGSITPGMSMQTVDNDEHFHFQLKRCTTNEMNVIWACTILNCVTSKIL